MLYRFIFLFCMIWRTWSSTNIWSVPSSAKKADTQTTIILVRNQVEWQNAAEGCKKLGASLARIDNEYLQMMITSFARNEWSNDWKDAWFALVWSDTEWIWADNCESFNSSAWNMFDTSANGNAKVNRGCYSLDQSSLLWVIEVCSNRKYFLCSREDVSNYTISKSNLYDSVVNTQLNAVDLARSSPSDCREMCDKVYGCYLASYLGNGSCILGVLGNTSNTYIKSKNVIADNYTFSSDQLQSTQSKQDYNICTSAITNSSVADGYISLNSLNQLSSTQVVCASTTTLPTQSYTEASSTYSSTSSTNLTQQSDMEISTQAMPSLCVTNIIQYNLTKEEKENLISAIISELIVDAKSTLKSQSQRYSAEDERPSAQALGYVAVGVICFVVCVIFVIDAPNVYFCFLDHRKVGKIQ